MAEIVFSEEAKQTLEQLATTNEKLVGRILAAIRDHIGTWDPGEEDRETIRHLSRVSTARRWNVYRLKIRKELGQWRVFFYMIHRPREILISTIVQWKGNEGTYDDPSSTHLRSLARQIENFVLEGRIDRRRKG